MLLFVLAGPAVAGAQWLNYRTPGIPRLANGAPDLKAAAPRTADGKPDFSGMWFANVPPRDIAGRRIACRKSRMAREQIDLGINLKDGLPYTEWSKEQMKVRHVNGGREDPHSYCMPPNFPRAWTLPQHSRIVQTPGMMVVLHRVQRGLSQIYLDGRPAPGAIRIRRGTVTRPDTGKATPSSSRPMASTTTCGSISRAVRSPNRPASPSG